MLSKFDAVVRLLPVVTALAVGGMAQAQDGYPSQPITLVVSFAAGGNADIVARLNARGLSDQLGVPVKVVNVPGGAHIPAAMKVLESPADGYTLFQWSPPSMVVVPLTRKVPYDPVKDFTPLFADQTASNALYVRADSKIETFEQFIEVARAERLTIGVNNLGAPPNLSAVQLAQEFGLEFTTLTLKTVPATMTGLIGGHVDVAVGQVASGRQYGDQVRPLIILDNQREAYFEKDLPGVRTVGEAFPGKNAATWVNGGLAVKAGTPDHIVQRLVEASDAAINNEEYVKAVPPTITYRWIGGVDAVSAKIQEGIDLYSPLLDSLGLLAKK